MHKNLIVFVIYSYVTSQTSLFIVVDSWRICTSWDPVCPSSNIIFLVQWVNIVLPSSIRPGIDGVNISRACRTTLRASTAWALSKLWNTCRTILLWIANLAMIWLNSKCPWYLDTKRFLCKYRVCQFILHRFWRKKIVETMEKFTGKLTWLLDLHSFSSRDMAKRRS